VSATINLLPLQSDGFLQAAWNSKWTSMAGSYQIEGLAWIPSVES